MWDLVSWPGVEPRHPALGAQNLSHWTTREVLRPLLEEGLKEWLWRSPGQEPNSSHTQKWKREPAASRRGSSHLSETQHTWWFTKGPHPALLSSTCSEVGWEWGCKIEHHQRHIISLTGELREGASSLLWIWTGVFVGNYIWEGTGWLCKLYFLSAF